MASHLLSTITITTTTGNWTAGDKVTSFFDTTTLLVSAKKNDVSITSGDPFVGIYLLDPLTGITDSTQYGAYWSRASENYWYNNSGNDIYFYRSNSFPFMFQYAGFINTPGEEADGDVNNISISIASVTTATLLTSDGQITAVATGTNTPFTYSTSAFINDAGQSSGTFSSLPAGTYTITALDSLGYMDSASVAITNTPTTYATRWTHASKNPEGETFRFRIQQRGYLGGNSDVTAGPKPFILATRGEGNDFHENTIIATQGTVSVLSETQGKYNDIAIGDEEEFLVIFDKYNGASYDLKWQGYVGTNTFSEVIATTPYMTRFICYDRLGDMKNLNFNRGNSFFGTGVIRGQITELEALVIMLDNTGLSQGYRIACNIFDATHTTSNNTPLNQTVFDSDIYTDFSGEGFSTTVNYTKSDVVIKDILKKYGAELRNWEGYWTIRRKTELISSETVNYVEYTSAGVYSTTGSWTPRLSFKSAEETSLWRWQGGAQSWSNTNSYKNVAVRINAKKAEAGILKESTLRYDDDLILSLSEDGDGYFSQGTSNAYFLYNDSIQFDRNDSLILSVEYQHDIGTQIVFSEHGNKPPYIPLKWMLKVGTKYVDAGGQWSATETFNEYFIDNFNTKGNFEIPIPLDDVDVSTLNYRLRLYIPSIFDYNVSGSSEAAMIATLKAIGTTTTTGGARRICRADNTPADFAYYYYELRSFAVSLLVPDLIADEPNIVVPTDYHVTTNPKFWQLVTTRTYPQSISSPISRHKYLEIKLEQLPGGLEPLDTIDINNSLSAFNKIDYFHEINLFDQDENINNDENIYSNTTRFTDGTSTGKWTELGGSVVKTIQGHLIDFISSILKKPRKKVNGNVYTDLEISPLNLLLDQGDSNKLFDLSGVSFNYFKNIHSGEIIEIGSDDTSTARAHDSGHEFASHS
jgi:hypothetical protein